MRLEYFQMLDRIVDIDIAERRIRSTCAVPTDSPVFVGHFPTYPLMPGVLLIECMAQTGGWLANSLRGFTVMPILATVKDAKFRAPVYPGDSLDFEAKLVHDGSGYAVTDSKGWRDGTPVCEARLTYRTVPYPTPELRQELLNLAERLSLPVSEYVR
jgi:3-hydroxyacyl-[acyl-carrier-protein] dehydratase